MEQSPKKPFVKGYKYRIYPTDTQKQFLTEVFGANRFLWNQLLKESNEAYEIYKLKKGQNPREEIEFPNTSGYGLCKKITLLKETHPWMNLYSNVAFQQTAINLGRAYANFYRGHKLHNRVGRPKFKKRSYYQSFRLTSVGFRLKGKELFIAKLDTPLKVIWSRELPNEPNSITITKNASNEYYVSFMCDYTPQKTIGQTNVGIDLGLKTYATLSTGDKLENPRWLQNHLKSLKRHQQSLSRKTKGSKNRTKARIKVAKLHQKVTNARHDWQHKATRTLVNNSHVIGVEALAVANMIRNRKLSKAIQDAAWSSFFTKLQYKVVESQHATLIYMSRFFPSSHICSLTGKQLERKLSLSERTWDCPFCGNTHDRDLNAAANIENKAMELYATLPVSKSHHGEVAVVAG